MRRLLLALALALAPLCAAHAQLSNAIVVSMCGTPPITYVAGKTRQVTQDTAGNVCTDASATGTFDNPAAGTTGNAVPGSADYQGLNIGGTLRGQTGKNPTGVVYAADVNIASITGYAFSNITTAATTVVKSGAGVVHTICVNALGTVASTAIVYDNTAGSGTKIGTISTLTLLGCQTYDVAFATGLTLVTTGTVAPDITVSYR